MLSRILYSGEDWLMTVDWFGLGSVYVLNRASKKVTRAHPAQKHFLLGVAEALRTTGGPFVADDPTAKDFMRSIAEDIGLYPAESVQWASLFRTGPHRFVANMLAIESRQKRDV